MGDWNEIGRVDWKIKSNKKVKWKFRCDFLQPRKLSKEMKGNIIIDPFNVLKGFNNKKYLWNISSTITNILMIFIKVYKELLSCISI